MRSLAAGAQGAYWSASSDRERDSGSRYAHDRNCSHWLLRLMTPLVVVALVLYHRHWLVDALSLLRTVELPWVLAALGTIGLSYFVSSYVFRVVLASFGHRLGALRLWATTVTAIVISQCVPAGGVGSYAFLLRSFKLRGIPASQAALLAALEALSYVGPMLLIVGSALCISSPSRLERAVEQPPSRWSRAQLPPVRFWQQPGR